MAGVEPLREFVVLACDAAWNIGVLAVPGRTLAGTEQVAALVAGWPADRI